jgi:hypothetical protein
MALEVTCPPAGRHGVVLAWVRRSRSPSLRGLCRPFSRVRRVDRTGVGGTVPRGCCWPCRTASHSGGDGLVGGVGGAVPGRDSQARRGIDSSLTQAPVNVSALNPPVGGASMEAVGRDALERDRNLLEGALSSRSRRDLARGGVQPQSEAESHSKECSALERGGVLPVQHRHHRAKRSSTGGCPSRLSGGPRAREFILRALLGSFMFYIL